MQISSATYNMQISAKTYSGQDSATAFLFDTLVSDASSSDIEDADITNTSAANLHSILASSALEKSGFTDEDIRANKLANVNYTGAMQDPTKYLTQSDIALYEKTTGGAIKEGIIIGNDKDTSGASMNLALQLCFLRMSGAVPSSQDITAADLQAVVKNYQSGPGAYDTSMLEKALDVLSSEKA
ncbi:hypothetical protein H4S14_003552 [Agrobacterium vitis]|nr:hypothetical protein [Agrobacterium vitis]MBE1439787.1 hypothetical protein [Agrobacterium vitis]